MGWLELALILAPLLVHSMVELGLDVNEIVLELNELVVLEGDEDS